MRNAPELCGSGKGPLITDKLARAPHRAPPAPHPLPGPSGRNAALCRAAAAPGRGAWEGGQNAVPAVPPATGQRGRAPPGGSRRRELGLSLWHRGVRSSAAAPGG